MPEPLPQSEIRAGLLKYAAFCLNRRPYFREVIRQKLTLRAKKLKYPNSGQIITDILDDLQKSGYLDDQYLAGAFVRRQLGKGYGPRIISLKLAKFHLDRDSLDMVLSEEASVEHQLEAIEKFASKYRKLDNRLLISKLYARGFSSSVINKLFDSSYIEE